MSTARLGHLSSHIPFSLVDGPGNRFVLFLQGCNFNCPGCHNPHTIASCNGCGLCIDECPETALVIGLATQPDVDRHLCTMCEICVDVCPYDSTPLSRWVSVDDVVTMIRPAARYLSGVTVSGGEATLQADFVRDVFDAVKADPELSHLTTFVDSNGSAPQQTWDLLAPSTDGVMVDLKALDPSSHMTLTGASNESVLESIRYLHQLGLLYEVRLLLVAGVNDGAEAIDATCSWLRSAAPSARIKVIAYRDHGVRPSAADLRPPAPERLDAVAGQLRDTGFANVAVI